SRPSMLTTFILVVHALIALALVAVDGLTATEAAERLGASPTAVRMRLSRARRTVRGRLGDVADPTNTTELPPEVAK
ncbi:MAG TPA: sigma factor-like helix-turn-helix DNA-binding protein, partial [Microthrixaceae bacterium]|nr:sigma factor-like helix-turn-helix DNA-binding protein [Microthrixaceae bacterium]